jgi:hypothetical protein
MWMGQYSRHFFFEFTLLKMDLHGMQVIDIDQCNEFSQIFNAEIFVRMYLCVFVRSQFSTFCSSRNLFRRSVLITFTCMTKINTWI